MTAFPTLPIVTAVAGAMILAGCDARPRQDEITRVCQDAAGRRTTDENCARGAGGHSFAYIYGRPGAYGDPVNAPRSNPGDVRRGGFGMSAHSSSGA